MDAIPKPSIEMLKRGLKHIFPPLGRAAIFLRLNLDLYDFLGCLFILHSPELGPLSSGSLAERAGLRAFRHSGRASSGCSIFAVVEESPVCARRRQKLVSLHRQMSSYVKMP